MQRKIFGPMRERCRKRKLESLYSWFLQKCSEGVSVNGVILIVQAVQFNLLLGGDKTFNVSDRWLW
jgi:hypothetical protein